MLKISELDIRRRIEIDNPWWSSGRSYGTGFGRRRSYFKQFYRLVMNRRVRRAIILLGPRRVGKTVMLLQTIEQMLSDGEEAKRVLYISVDQPFYVGCPLEKLIEIYQEAQGIGREELLYVFFDEIQYFPNWENTLKSLVDSFPNIRFTASGSAAAALRAKSIESGAGRFTDFLLPPLTFKEFCDFVEFSVPESTIEATNERFVEYINYGGFPEAVLSDDIRRDMGRFIRGDIIDKILLRDLPSIYGISDTRDLNRFFTSVAFNTSHEVDIQALSSEAGISEPTVRKFLEYLEAAFLVRRLHRVSETARRFKRVRRFKVYLTNPSIRAALFGPVMATDEAAGPLAETTVLSHIMQTDVHSDVYYSRWSDGEVDVVLVEPGTQKPSSPIEIRWSDKLGRSRLTSLEFFCSKNNLKTAWVLTKSKQEKRKMNDTWIFFQPISTFCYALCEKNIEPLLERGIHPLLGDLADGNQLDLAI